MSKKNDQNLPTFTFIEKVSKAGMEHDRRVMDHLCKWGSLIATPTVSSKYVLNPPPEYPKPPMPTFPPMHSVYWDPSEFDNAEEGSRKPTTTSNEETTMDNKSSILNNLKNTDGPEDLGNPNLIYPEITDISVLMTEHPSVSEDGIKLPKFQNSGPSGVSAGQDPTEIMNASYLTPDVLARIQAEEEQAQKERIHTEAFFKSQQKYLKNVFTGAYAPQQTSQDNAGLTNPSSFQFRQQNQMNTFSQFPPTFQQPQPNQGNQMNTFNQNPQQVWPQANTWGGQAASVNPVQSPQFSPVQPWGVHQDAWGHVNLFFMATRSQDVTFKGSMIQQLQMNIANQRSRIEILKTQMQKEIACHEETIMQLTEILQALDVKTEEAPEFASEPTSDPITHLGGTDAS